MVGEKVVISDSLVTPCQASGSRGVVWDPIDSTSGLGEGEGLACGCSRSEFLSFTEVYIHTIVHKSEYIFFIGSYKFVSYVFTQSSATKLLYMIQVFDFHCST